VLLLWNSTSRFRGELILMVADSHYHPLLLLDAMGWMGLIPRVMAGCLGKKAPYAQQ